MNKNDIEQLRPLIQMAIEEDLNGGDVTSELFFTDQTICQADIVSREKIVVCGTDTAREVLRLYDQQLKLQVLIEDGHIAKVGEKIAIIEGPGRSMLSAERVVLNFMQRLSGIATLTRKYVDAVEGTRAKIYDTRKTTPGWRKLEKYAVRCGGGFNHRMGLYDGVLIKDNHIAQLGGDILKLDSIIKKARENKNIQFVAVEVDSIETQLPIALKIEGIDFLLLDNMTPEQLRQAVDMRNEIGSAALLEASGNVTLANVTEVAKTGVDRIAIGAITHSATAVDIGLDR